MLPMLSELYFLYIFQFYSNLLHNILLYFILFYHVCLSLHYVEAY